MKQGLVLNFGILILGCLIGLRVLISSTNAAPTPELVAQEALPKVLGRVAQHDYQHYGFADPAEIERATLGKPYQGYLLLPEAAARYRGGRSAELFTRQDRLIFPVLVDGLPRGLLSVELIEGQWQFTRYGDLPLSQHLLAFEQERKNQVGHRMSGGELALLDVNQLNLTVGMVLDAQGERFAPLIPYPKTLKSPVSDMVVGEPAEAFLPRVLAALQSIGLGTKTP